jgi:hypothetical protein
MASDPQSPTTELRTQLQTDSNARQAVCEAVDAMWVDIYSKVRDCGDSVPEEFEKYVIMALHFNASMDIRKFMCDKTNGAKNKPSKEERAPYRQWKLLVKERVPKKRYEVYTSWKQEHRAFVLDPQVVD